MTKKIDKTDKIEELPKKKPLKCLNCLSEIKVRKAQFCPYCGHSLKSSVTDLMSSAMHETASLIPEHIPTEEPIQFTIGTYQVLRSIGRGGMGEVFLAYDTTCGRRIALKQIRDDLLGHIQIHNRFLKEARITSQLTHPSIIPIYAIHQDDSQIYYTMPFVEGETLKQILRKTRQQEKKGEKLDHLGGSIPALIRIFINICQAVAYAHSKSVLHRDLKPENVIVGKYGEVLILDWGLAKMLQSEDSFDSLSEEDHPHLSLHGLTHTGRVVGTIAYMAPERALGHPATPQTDIYSLGVILYQLLTLKPPFRRGTLKEFKKNLHKEVLEDPASVAPYRDVPRMMSKIVEKCLALEMEKRYNSVQELLYDLETYVEGRADWFLLAKLNILNKVDWEFQENVLIAEHIAITRNTEETEWVSFMISKASFTGNVKIEATVYIGDLGNGIGFVLSIPEASKRVHLLDGYCLWFGSDANKSTKLLKSTVEVADAPDVFLKRNEWHRLRIEKVEQNIHVYLNDVLQFSYIGFIPLIGTHIGFFSKDGDFEISDFNVYVSSLNITVNCLAVPDAFLAQKDYETALSEYRRIGYSFSGRAEGREAIFRAGLTLIEQAKSHPSSLESLDLAITEFEKLHHTPGAPLEYLGKALVYQTLRDVEDEVKCFELAYRRYPHHPLLPILQEQILSRMHECARFHRRATYKFILLALRHLPLNQIGSHTQRLFNSLQKHWESLPFIEELSTGLSKKLKNYHFGIQLAFWLAKPYVIGEILDNLIEEEENSLPLIYNAFLCLIELGSWEFAEAKIADLKAKLTDLSIDHSSFDKIFEMALSVIQWHKQPLEKSVKDILKPKDESKAINLPLITSFFSLAIDAQNSKVIHEVASFYKGMSLSSEEQLLIDIYEIQAFFLEKNWTLAGEILSGYPYELLNKESTPLHYLYGCWLYVTEGREIALIHFSGVLEVSYPRSWTLFSHYIVGHLAEAGWFQKAFLWEKRQLYRQASLFFHCIGDPIKEKHYRHLIQREFIHVSP